MREKKVKRIANEINTYKHYLFINLKKKKIDVNPRWST